MRRHLPHHGRNGSRHCGRLRHRAAEILRKGLGFWIDVDDIVPVTGAWRTCRYFDVYRWQVFTTRPSLNPGGQAMPYSMGCWLTLTQFVKEASKHGFHVDKDDEIWPGPEKPNG